MQSSLPAKLGVVLVLVGIAAVPGSSTTGGVPRSDLRADARLISVEPLSTDSRRCQLSPSLRAAATDAIVTNPVTVALALASEQTSAGRAAVSAAPNEAKRLEVENRKPLRTIRDRYSQFSAVAVDNARDEVVIQDENLFQVLVYDRTANTPPKATMSEPKRAIGGSQTHLELNCAVYIDPSSGNIYAVNNDTEDHLVVFDRQAKGDVPPTWSLHTPHGAFGIAVDEAAKELILTIQHSNAVVAFPKTARDDDPPTRLLQGDQTLLADPHGIALDTKRNLIFVGNFGSTTTPRLDKGGYIHYNRTKFKPGSKEFWPLDPGQMVPGSGRSVSPSITVYSKNARGDVAPLRVITGPQTQLNWPAGLFVDAERGELYVANDGGGSVLVFSADASGDVAPIRVLKGPQTLLSYPSSVFVDFRNEELWVANFGNHTATVYHRTAAGNAAPIRKIRSAPTGTPGPALANARIAYDTKREQILAPNCVGHPQIAVFDRLGDGNAQAVRRIEGQKTMLARTMHSIIYDALHDEVVVPNALSLAVLTFRGGASGEEAPIRVIQGPKTGLLFTEELDVDPVHNEIYVPMRNGEGAVIHVFDRTAKGDVAPLRILGPNSGLGGSSVTADPEHNLLLADGRRALLIFNRTDSGNAKPLRTISGGPKSGTTAPRGPVMIPGTRMFVATARTFGAPEKKVEAPVNFQSPEEAQSFIGVWSIDDDGDVAPRWTVAHHILKEARNLAVDPKHKTVMIADKGLNAILTFYFPEAFAYGPSSH